MSVEVFIENMKDETEFIYTLSSKGSMVQDACYSIISLSRFVDEENITVILTPPINDSDFEKLKQLGINVERREHFVEKMFKMDEYEEKRSYGD